MANITLMADTRRQPVVNGSQTAILKLRIRIGKNDSTLATGVKVADIGKVDLLNMQTGPLLSGAIGSAVAEKSANVMLRNMWARATATMYEMDMVYGVGGYTIDAIKQKVLSEVAPAKAELVQARHLKKQRHENNVLKHWREFLTTKHGRNLEIYHTTERRLREYLKKDGQRWWTDELQFEDMTTDWLNGWVKSMSKGQKGKVVECGNGAKRKRTTADVSTCRIYLSCLRAFCNWAYKEERTQKDVFRGFEVPRGQNAEVEPLTDMELKELFCAPPKGEEWMQPYLDTALLGMMLIGINMVDMFGLRNRDYKSGYVRYTRAKTGRPYKIRVEPCAKALLERLRNADRDPDAPLLQWAADNKDHKSYVKHLNKVLHDKGELVKVSCQGGYRKVWTPCVEGMHYYRLRHTWATLAYKLKVIRDDIRQALGHGKREVTDVYIKYGQEPIDEANKKVCAYLVGLLCDSDSTTV